VIPVTGSTRRNNPFILGVAGGSGSGKTTFARTLQARLGEARCEIVYQDSFYIDQSHRFDRDGGAVNFDHPDAIDFPLLAEKLGELKAGASAKIPIYDFATHKRLLETLTARPTALVIVDGILIFHSEVVRKLLDDRIFFVAPEDVRFRRRLERDVRERGRNPEGVREQFLKQVKPMHDQFVEPSKAFARFQVRSDAAFPDFEDAIAQVIGRVGF
jgi:uridine kinase